MLSGYENSNGPDYRLGKGVAELEKERKVMKTLFINGSPNKDGNTAALAKALLAGKEYETLNLTDYKIYSYGQPFRKNSVFPVPGRGSGKVDAGSRGVYHEPLCEAVRPGIRGNGD